MADDVYDATIYEPTAEFVAHAYLLLKYYIQYKAHWLGSYMVYFEAYAIIYYVEFQVHLNVWNQYGV